MCSLSFAPGSKVGNFTLLMNRDEQRSRPVALPPALRRFGAMRALFPSESSGGTWIGLNEASLTLALINWYAKPQKSGVPLVSRGTLIPALLAASSSAEAEEIFLVQQLRDFQPFRLILISPRESLLWEWQYDGHLCQKQSYDWAIRHWFSSGYEEELVAQERSEYAHRHDLELKANDPLEWLRSLHRSHHCGKGPFSLCMHRDDAKTVSMTEITIAKSEGAMRYFDGSPCESFHCEPTTQTLAFGITQSKIAP